MKVIHSKWVIDIHDNCGDLFEQRLKSKLGGTGFPSYLDIQDRHPYDTQEITISPAKRYARKQAKARERRRQNAPDRLEHDRHQAQQAAKALRRALDELGLPDGLVREIEGRLRSQQKLLGKIIGVMSRQKLG